MIPPSLFSAQCAPLSVITTLPLADEPPRATNVNFGDVSPEVGTLLTGVYTYSHPNSKAEGDSTYQWYTTTTQPIEPEEELDLGIDFEFTPISGANSQTYTPTVAEEGLYMWYGVVPIAASGTNPIGSEVISGGEGIPVVAAETGSAPTATSVSIASDYGTVPDVFEVLSGVYTYGDVDGDVEGATVYEWLRDDVVIVGAESQTYQVAVADIASTLKFRVTPVSATGSPTVGTPVTSSATPTVPDPGAGLATTAIAEIVLAPTGYTVTLEQDSDLSVEVSITPTAAGMGDNREFFTALFERVPGADEKHLSRLLIHNTGGCKDSNTPAWVNTWIRLESITIKIPTGQTIGWASYRNARYVETADGRDVYTLLDATDDILSHAGYTFTDHIIDGGRRVQWEFGPTDHHDEFPVVDCSVGTALHNALRREWKFPTTGSDFTYGYGKRDLLLNRFYRSGGQAIDTNPSATDAQQSAAWWFFTSVIDGSSQENWLQWPALIEVLSTPTFQGHTCAGNRYNQARHFLADWFQSYLDDPEDTQIESYRFGLALARWAFTRCQKETWHNEPNYGTSYSNHLRNSETSSGDYPGDGPGSHGNWNWQQELLLYGKLSGDDRMFETATNSIHRYRSVGYEIAGQQGHWRGFRHSRWMFEYLKNCLTAYRMSGDLTYAEYAEECMDKDSPWGVNCQWHYGPGYQGTRTTVTTAGGGRDLSLEILPGPIFWTWGSSGWFISPFTTSRYLGTIYDWIDEGFLTQYRSQIDEAMQWMILDQNNPPYSTVDIFTLPGGQNYAIVPFQTKCSWLGGASVASLNSGVAHHLVYPGYRCQELMAAGTDRDNVRIAVEALAYSSSVLMGRGLGAAQSGALSDADFTYDFWAEGVYPGTPYKSSGEFMEGSYVTLYQHIADDDWSALQ